MDGERGTTCTCKGEGGLELWDQAIELELWTLRKCVSCEHQTWQFKSQGYTKQKQGICQDKHNSRDAGGGGGGGERNGESGDMHAEIFQCSQGTNQGTTHLCVSERITAY